MPEVYFTHPVVDRTNGGPLRISTGANEITWGYGLNYQTYPTYGGEVVQILSAYTDDLAVQGDVRTYAEMEHIYEWFLSYIQTSTQVGNEKLGVEAFNQTPITFAYPARGWEQNIFVTELPGFKYGRDVVIPQYQIKAHVVESRGDLNDMIVDAATERALERRGFDLDQFGRVTAGIGFIEENPFSDPFPKLDKTEIDEKTRDLYKQLGDYYTSFIPAYMESDITGKLADYGSVPAFLRGGTGAKDSPGNEVGESVKDASKRGGDNG